MGRIFVTFAEGSPLGDFRVAVMRVGAEGLPADIPAEGATQNHVGSEVLMPHKAGSAYASCRAVGQHLCQRAGILMSDHTRNRPTDRRVLGRERSPALKKMSLAAARKGALPTEGILEDFRIEECVDAGFSAKKSGFALLIVVREVSQHKHSSTDASHRTQSGIGSGNSV